MPKACKEVKLVMRFIKLEGCKFREAISREMRRWYSTHLKKGSSRNSRIMLPKNAMFKCKHGTEFSPPTDKILQTHY